MPARRIIETHTDGSLLVLVHPGSLCGSLDMHEGDKQDPQADAVRWAIRNEVEKFAGQRIAILGEFGDEIARYEDVQAAVDACPLKMEAGPWEEDLEDAAELIAKRFPGAHTILVTGAWADPGDGCVTTVADALKQALPQAKVQVSANAARTYDDDLDESVPQSLTEDAKPVIYRDRVVKDGIQMCPHCQQEIHEKGTYGRPDPDNPKKYRFYHGTCGGELQPRPMTPREKEWLEQFTGQPVTESLGQAEVAVLQSPAGQRLLNSLFMRYDPKANRIVDRAREEYVKDGRSYRRDTHEQTDWHNESTADLMRTVKPWPAQNPGYYRVKMDPVPLLDGQYESIRYGYTIEINGQQFPTKDGVRCTRERAGDPKPTRVFEGKVEVKI